MAVFNVMIPIAGHAFITVEADSEDAAIEEAMEQVTLVHIEEWEALPQFTKGNVCYCPSPWEAVAEMEGE